MYRSITICLLINLCNTVVRSQAVFNSASTGNWNEPATWSLQSGATSLNYPVAGDTVIITGGHIVTANDNLQCGQLAINNGSQLQFSSNASILSISNGVSLSASSAIAMNQGAMTVTGTFTITGASHVTVNQGALTVIGLAIVSAPVAAGQTLLEVNGGIFTCAGGLSITGLSATRQAELRIGNSAVNVVGSLITATPNARINFTGSGTLTLAGIINIPDAASFIAGTGRVIYVGIPGTDQVVAPLNYYRLLIAGTGAGVKEINGPVSVSDTLTLINDTLMITGGQLTLLDDATVVRTAGKLMQPPVFAGRVNLVYNNFARDTTGAELPAAANALQVLTINDGNGLDLAASCTVNGRLVLTDGALRTQTHTLTISNVNGGVSTDPAVERGTGYIIGRLSRKIGTGTGFRNFPLGTGTAYREFNINYTSAPSSPGLLTVQHIDEAADAQSGLPVADEGASITSIFPAYWQADATEGLAGGVYQLSVTGADIAGISSPLLLRMVKRSGAGNSWIAQGVAGSNSGTAELPVVVRTELSGFSQFAIGQGESAVLAAPLLSFQAFLSGNNIRLTWSTANEHQSRDFTVLHSQDGVRFTELGLVPAAGESTSTRYYQFFHDNPDPGTHYYRLRETNVNGHFTYSNTVMVKTQDSKSWTITPTLAYNILTLRTDVSQPVKLYNAMGTYLMPLQAGDNDISHLTAGIYYVAGGGIVQKFVKALQ